MALIDELWRVCQELSNQGWNDFLIDSWALHIDTGDDRERLAANLNRTYLSPVVVPGFEDFAGGTKAKGIEPGNPGKSILYHALASPGVMPRSISPEYYPTLEQIEIIENYVFASLSATLSDLKALFPGATMGIVPFALEYRQAAETPHRHHADLTFSRTGIMRVGNEKPLYSKQLRSFETFEKETARKGRVHALACRFAPFLAVQLKGDKSQSRPFRFRTEPNTNDGDNPDQVPDDQLNFWIPVHKLFSGSECVTGLTLQVDLEVYAENIKLRKIHQSLAVLGRDSGHHEPQITDAPFVECDRIPKLEPPDEYCANLIELTACGVIRPMQHELAALVPGRDPKEPLTFEVPPDLDNTGSSLQFFPRPQYWAPEFVHVRFRHQTEGSRFEDLNTKPMVVDRVADGEYRAAHVRDFTCDGFVSVKCQQLLTLIHPRASAYFVLAQPDPLPLVKQSDLMEWWENLMPAVIQKNLWYNPPRPLCDDRFPANVHLKNSDFRVDDKTVSAVVGFAKYQEVRPAQGASLVQGRSTALPDDASGIFAPGWDVGLDRTAEQTTRSGDEVKPFTHLAAYGLGSPFAEDAKLCAAMSAYWPAAAPDTARSYEPTINPTVTPLTDEELEWHPVAPPKLISEPTASNPGTLLYPTRAYADYARSLLSEADLNTLGIDPNQIGHFDTSRVMGITFEEYTTRTITMARAYLALGAVSDISSADDADETDLLAPGKDSRSDWVVFQFKPYDESLLCKGQPRPPADFSGYFIKLYRPVGQRPGLDQDFDKTIVYFNRMIEVVANPTYVLIYDTNKKKWSRPKARKPGHG